MVATLPSVENLGKFYLSFDFRLNEWNGTTT